MTQCLLQQYKITVFYSLSIVIFYFQPSILAFTLLSIELPRYVNVHNTSDTENLDWVLTGLQHFTKVIVLTLTDTFITKV